MTVRILHGDALEQLRTLADESVHSVVTDPPYGLEFMGKDWDKLSDDPVSKSWDTRGRTMTAEPIKNDKAAGSRHAAQYGNGDNPRCSKCGRAVNGRDTAKGFKVCHCEEPAIYAPSTSAKKMQAWHEKWAREVFRVLKPGGHLLSFGGSRTYHRMACAIEDAGFEIRDQIMWVYGSGFPKSLDVSKAIDRTAPRAGMFDAFAKHFAERRAASGKTQKELAALFPSKTGGLTGCIWNWENGANVPTREQWEILQPLLDLSLEWLPLIERIEAERKIIGRSDNGIAGGTGQHAGVPESYGFAGEFNLTTPATDAARQWQGWGTALKPAHEPIVVARKPLIGTVAANVLKHGTGAINVDACRVGMDGEVVRTVQGQSAAQQNGAMYSGKDQRDQQQFKSHALGRWPANLILSYPEDEYEVRSELSAEQKRELYGWLGANA